MEKVILNCEFCNYTTNRKFNLKRHRNAVHNVKTSTKNDSKKHIHLEKKHIQFERKHIQFERKHMETDSECLFCSKCAKKYKTKKSLIGHEEKCIGLNILTCPKCMKNFSNTSNKSAHIKKNTCKANSIINTVNPDVKYNLYINGNNNNTTINNIKKV